MHDTRAFDLAVYDAVVFDLDGTLWISGHSIPGAAAFVERCRRSGATVSVATNISISTAAGVRQRLVEEGLLHQHESVMTSSLALAASLKAAGVRRAAVLGGSGLHHEIAALGIVVHDVGEIDRDVWRTPRPDAAIALGGWPDARLRDIETVGMLAAAGLPLYVTSLEPGFPNATGYQAGAGMMIAAARALHGFEVIVCGKPSASYAAAVIGSLPPGVRVLMVGDSLLADVVLAAQMGADSLLLVGDRTFETASGGNLPTFVASSLLSEPAALAESALGR